MPITSMNKPFNQSKSKLRLLWETAFQLIGEYEAFDEKLSSLEDKTKTLSDNLNSTINGTPNV
jgi:hypothetical protein